MPTVLVIDDNPAVATALEVLLSLRDLKTVAADSPAAGLAVLERETVDVVIEDMNFRADTTSGQEGVALFRAIRARFPDMPVILMTAWTQLESAVELVKAGAADYLAKPWDDTKLLTAIQNLLELSEARRELARRLAGETRRRTELEQRYDLCSAVFADPAMERVIALACQVARADVPVLITGPNGAGKEKIAEIVQANSAVREGPFVTLNCGALPSELLEAELFGAEVGAYTGANRSREGKFESADGGTLFLDEIGNLSPNGQMKLLRVLETGRFERLGSNKERQVKVRVISATNADVAAMIRAGTFREDLYYRLNTIEIRLPPLSERVDDILPLARLFLAADKRLSADAREALKRHSWPGNVRELKNALQRASLLATGPEITAADLALPRTAVPPPDDELDRATIEAALARTGGVIAQAAAELGLSRQALYRRMEKLSIPLRMTSPPTVRRSSLAWRLALVACALVVAAVGLTLLMLDWFGDPIIAGGITLVVLLPLSIYIVRRPLAPVLSMFRALSGTVTSYRDGDFAFSLAWKPNDELGDLVTAHNELGNTLRRQRESLVHRELLLDTMVQNTPVAMLLVDPGDHIVYGNLAARKLLADGRRLEGVRFRELLEAAPEALREAIDRGGDGLFLVEREGEEEVFHLARSSFRLNGRPHELFVLRHLTAELHRQEVRTWKKVIRVISHELNNSLAPVASLAHSGGELLKRGKYEQLEKVFTTIAERARHLEQFIQGYAKFAKLPTPRVESTPWPELVERLRGQVAFSVDGPLPEAPGRFDPAQLEQALVNLLRNALESGSPADGVGLRVRKLPSAVAIEVSDRGAGMTETVLSNALLPFYSTKRGGTGLGLALVREITEAHGGRVSLANREGGGLSVTITLPQ